MAIGPLVRSWLGPLERPAAELYRAFFFNVTQFVAAVRRAVPDATRILEVGCGEGAVCERLARAYPHAAIVGIDITPRVGRMFRGDRGRVTFHRRTVEELAAEQPGQFDLVLIADVLHHVPRDQRAGLLRTAARALAPDGRLVLKDWERRGNWIHPVCHFTDACIANDPGVCYGTADEFRALVREVFGDGAAVRERRFSPWPNNLAFFVRPGKG
jgi:2-polyprenyl-6-hydroxyphenyl methylase/3-demethylubiquinone-9 3-methyltransferase